MSKTVQIAIRVSTGKVYHSTLSLEGRFPAPPRVRGWVYDQATSTWSRKPTNANIDAEVRDLDATWRTMSNADGSPHADRCTVLGWQRLSPAESAIFERDRVYRNALVIDEAGAIVHDMPKARECHRNHLRRLRAHALPQLDAAWTRAMGQGKADELSATEAKRQAWRDAPADPRIDAATDLASLKAVTPEGIQ
jgi:hypothetical protein